MGMFLNSPVPFEAYKAAKAGVYFVDKSDLLYYIKDNVDEIREEFILMLTGERVNAKMQEYAATAKELNTKAQIYSAMVIYGLLTYEDGEVFIPSRELMEQFNQLLLSNERLGYVYRLAKESEKMLRATLSHDTDTMTEILEFVHNTESPIFEYNNETELSAVVNLVYLSARDKYRVEREDKAGKGFVDFVFYPERRHADAIILELKIDSTPEDAIQQIKNKNYARKSYLLGFFFCMNDRRNRNNIIFFIQMKQIIIKTNDSTWSNFFSSIF